MIAQWRFGKPKDLWRKEFTDLAGWRERNRNRRESSVPNQVTQCGRTPAKTSQGPGVCKCQLEKLIWNNTRASVMIYRASGKSNQLCNSVRRIMVYVEAPGTTKQLYWTVSVMTVIEVSAKYELGSKVLRCCSFLSQIQHQNTWIREFSWREKKILCPKTRPRCPAYQQLAPSCAFTQYVVCLSVWVCVIEDQT